jgi:hypothetical protein
LAAVRNFVEHRGSRHPRTAGSGRGSRNRALFPPPAQLTHEPQPVPLSLSAAVDRRCCYRYTSVPMLWTKPAARQRTSLFMGCTPHGPKARGCGTPQCTPSNGGAAIRAPPRAAASAASPGSFWAKRKTERSGWNSACLCLPSVLKARPRKKVCRALLQRRASGWKVILLVCKIEDANAVLLLEFRPAKAAVENGEVTAIGTKRDRHRNADLWVARCGSKQNFGQQAAPR